ncbi:MAG: hypothetical protein ACYCO5_04790 [Acidobacteriaceae bacterium]
MLSEDQYMERTPDLVAQIRKLREAAREQMDRFGKPEEYDVEILHGRKVPAETRKHIATDTPKQNAGDGAKP